jgi:hypothetical protein
MDPVLKEYLDSLKGDMALIKQSMDTHLDAVMGKQDYIAQQFEFQASSLSDLCGWKPDLEARFSRLQAVVEDLQRLQPASAMAASGFTAAPLGAAASCNNKGAIHGQFGLGGDSTPGGPSTVATVPPSVPPVTGTLSLQHPLTAIANPKHISSQIIAEGFRSIVNQKNSYGCEQESQDLI